MECPNVITGFPSISASNPVVEFIVITPSEFKINLYGFSL